LLAIPQMARARGDPFARGVQSLQKKFFGRAKEHLRRRSIALH
jgi:hypothetical protein